MSATHPPIEVSARFAGEYARRAPCFRGCVEGAVHDLVRAWRADPKTALRRYDRCAALGHDVLEIPIAGGPRMLATWTGSRFVLLHVGDHEIVSRYKPARLKNDLKNTTPAPAQFWPDLSRERRFFLRNPVETVTEYGNEFKREWLYYLSDAQYEAVEATEELCEVAVVANHQENVFLIGGPGTGKTSVLLTLLQDFHYLRRRVRIVLSDPVARYVDACNPGLQIDRFRISHLGAADRDGAVPRLAVLLVDDPDWYRIHATLNSPHRDMINLVVLAFDPLQLGSPLSDADFQQLVHNYDVTVLTMSDCYRQKANVGSYVKHIVDTIAESTPFKRDDKIQDFKSRHKQLTELANELAFPNPHGYLELHEQGGLAALRKEVDRIVAATQWRHWPPLLVVIDDALRGLTPPAVALLSAVEHETVMLSQLNRVKGLEYQHVFVFISQALFDEIERGFVGSGQNAYHQRRLLRIPFSRAKDSLVTFVIPSPDG